jgi:hypothetical protein
MNNRSEIKELWIPYKIPRTPDITNNDVYSLTCSNGANSNKNPSQFLQWKQVSLPQGTNLGDMLYWDPSAGEDNEGAWVVLESPSGSGLKVLTIQNRQLSWNDTEDCE